MAGIIGIYGLVVSVLISDGLKQELPLYTGFIQFGAGLSVGLSGLAAGFAIGIVGDAGVRGTAQQPRLFVGMILILIFAEVLGTHCHTPGYESLLTWARSLRSHCCATDELQGSYRYCLLESSSQQQYDDELVELALYDNDIDLVAFQSRLTAPQFASSTTNTWWIRFASGDNQTCIAGNMRRVRDRGVPSPAWSSTSITMEECIVTMRRCSALSLGKTVYFMYTSDKMPVDLERVVSP